MAKNNLAERLTALEAEVAHLKEKVEGMTQPKKPWTEQIAGTFANDPVYAEAMRLGREYRESLRPKPRKERKD